MICIFLCPYSHFLKNGFPAIDFMNSWCSMYKTQARILLKWRSTYEKVDMTQTNKSFPFLLGKSWFFSKRCWNINFDNSIGYTTAMDGQPICLVILIIVLNGRGEDIACTVARPGIALCARGKQRLYNRNIQTLITLCGHWLMTFTIYDQYKHNTVI